MASGYYDITSKTLGKGHYGVVKLGRHCLTGEPVAIKIIEKSRLNSDSLNQLGTEIRILFRLSEYEHPNILKLYQTIDTEVKLYLVTEYCGPHACDLHDYLSRKHCRDGLSEIEAQIFFVQICSAISYCHSMGIVHRDLKPENILVTDYRHINSKFSKISKHHTDDCNHNNYNIQNKQQCHQNHYPLLKLIDFGFANQWYPDEKMRTSCGTLAYSAPELLLGEPYDGTKVDVWGLGLMLYILLYGGNPFMQINDNETLTKILDCTFETPKRDNVNYNAIGLLRSLIKRDPDARLPMDDILKHEWFSNVPKSIENILLKYQAKHDSTPVMATATTNMTAQVAKTTTASPPSPLLQTPKQMPHQNKLTPNQSSTLPSISEIGPFKNFSKSSDDSLSNDGVSEQTNQKPKYNRTRSLSITRTHCKSNQHQQQQMSPLTHTRSSINLGRLNSNHQLNSQRAASIYRPTSPDVGSPTVAPTEEENLLHDNVIKEMFRLTKFIDSKSSIEASLKNARFTHRQFNQNSIQPAAISKRKLTTGLTKLLSHKKSADAGCATSSEQAQPTNSDAKTDKLSIINTKLSNDDYIYATYQLTRDRLLRVQKENLNDDRKQATASDRLSSSKEVILKEYSSSTTPGLGDDGSSAKENDNSRLIRQRKLLQPQHKMRDKFTSFFRSESTSPNGSFSVSCDSQGSGTGLTGTGGDCSFRDQANYYETHHHEAFNDHNNEHSATPSSRYYANKADIQDSSLAYALPLARKCSLVSEESACSNEPTDSHRDHE